MGRTRNKDTGLKGDEPPCPQGHPLKRVSPEGEFSCDVCQVDIPLGTCFYGCEPCDYSLCGACYVKLATNTLDESCFKLKDEDIDKRIEAEVADLCEHYELDFRIAQKMTEALCWRKETYEDDIFGLWQSLKLGKHGQVSGLAMQKIHLMNDGRYVYKQPPKRLFTLMEKYKLDEDATNKLTDLLAKRPATVENDIDEVEKRLECCTNPSSLTMKIIMAMNRGEELPSIREKPQWKGDKGGGKGDKGDKGDKGGGRGRSRSRDRDRRRDSDRDRRSSRDDYHGRSSRGSYDDRGWKS